MDLNMNLRSNNYVLNLYSQIKDLSCEDKEKKLLGVFKELAEHILSGYFLIKKNQSDSFVKVHPTCVEFYCHEEGEGKDKIKDYSAYHRNKEDRKLDKSVFPLGILHNHISGIDMTFEQGEDSANAIRLSALIREFRIDDSGKKEDKYDMEYINIEKKKNGGIVTKPTYLYDALYSQFSIFDGFSIQWIDGEKKAVLEESSELRINVPEYKVENNKHVPVSKKKTTAEDILTKNEKYKQCLRKWKFKLKQ